jgi:hypothetical protein
MKGREEERVKGKKRDQLFPTPASPIRRSLSFREGRKGSRMGERKVCRDQEGKVCRDQGREGREGPRKGRRDRDVEARKALRMAGRQDGKREREGKEGRERGSRKGGEEISCE